MAYSNILADRIRVQLKDLPNVEEKEMMGGLTFMYNSKMCIGIIQDELMCRIDPNLHEASILKTGCRTMDFTKRPMKGYVMVNESGMQTPEELNYWVGLCLEFNKKSKASKKKK